MLAEVADRPLARVNSLPNLTSLLTGDLSRPPSGAGVPAQAVSLGGGSGGALGRPPRTGVGRGRGAPPYNTSLPPARRTRRTRGTSARRGAGGAPNARPAASKRVQASVFEWVQFVSFGRDLANKLRYYCTAFARWSRAGLITSRIIMSRSFALARILSTSMFSIDWAVKCSLSV